MIHLSPEIAIEINKRMIEKYSKGELVGVKEPNLLDSAIHRPLQTMYGESLYQDIFEKAIALFESLARTMFFTMQIKEQLLLVWLIFYSLMAISVS